MHAANDNFNLILFISERNKSEYFVNCSLLNANNKMFMFITKHRLRYENSNILPRNRLIIFEWFPFMCRFKTWLWPRNISIFQYCHVIFTGWACVACGNWKYAALKVKKTHRNYWNTQIASGSFHSFMIFTLRRRSKKITIINCYISVMAVLVIILYHH